MTVGAGAWPVSDGRAARGAAGSGCAAAVTRNWLKTPTTQPYRAATLGTGRPVSPTT
jgi:hypothetical protein